MAKPMPQVFLVRTNPAERTTVEIRKAAGVWVVFYDGHPINEVKLWDDSKAHRIGRTIFGNPGHAFAAARRLNDDFGTDQFTVHKMEVVSDALEDPQIAKLTAPKRVYRTRNIKFLINKKPTKGTNDHDHADG